MADDKVTDINKRKQFDQEMKQMVAAAYEKINELTFS